MRSAMHDVLPTALRRSLSKVGHDLAVARRKRPLTVAMTAERAGLAKGTYARLERGDPAVAMGAPAMALFVLGFGEALGDLTDARRDEDGLLLDEERLPERVRIRKAPTPLRNRRSRISRARANEVLSRIEHPLSQWRETGLALGMTKQELARFADAFEHREREAAQQATKRGKWQCVKKSRYYH